ncbi:MAG: hypothetical protein HQ567_17020, partial [Candidatus Nealsonbacteria bacterium]|nr:hypothetical protein [Candidatus Nealsonbacteria bacterium]
MKRAAFILVVMVAFFPPPVARAAPVQGVTFGGTGITNEGLYTTGWEFSIAEPISVTHLGHVDMLNDGIVNSADVGIWSVATGALLDSVTVEPGSPSEASGVGSTLYEPITPLDLSPGNYIVAAQRNGEHFYFDTPYTATPGITWVAGKALASGPLPASTAAFNITRTQPGCYFGANFKFESGGAPSELTLSAPTGRAVFQRDDANLAEVAVEGTFSGSATRIEARAVPRTGFSGTPTGWQVIDNAPVGGTFSSSLAGVLGGWYDVEVKAFDGATELATATTQRVGVGEVFVMAGQSNSANHGSPQQQPDDGRVSARTSFSGNTWQVANDPQPTASGGGGSPWPELGDLVAAKYDVPVGLLSVGVGSTTVGQWLPGTGNYNSRLKPAIESLGADGFRAILWHQGESDSLAGTSPDLYQSRLESIIAQSRLDAAFDVPWGVATASYHPSSSAANEARVALGQQQVIDADPLVFQGALTDDFHTIGYLSDSVHFNQQGLDEHAARWLEQIDSLGIISASYIWTATGMGDWNDADNWSSSAPPNGDTASVVFGGAIGAASTVVSDAAVTVKSIEFNGLNGYAIAGQGSVNMQSDEGNASIGVLQGDHQFQAPVNLLSDTDVAVAAGASLTLNNVLNVGSHTLSNIGDEPVNIYNRLITGDGATLEGEFLVGGLLSPGAGAAATLAIGDGEIALATSAIFEAQVSLAAADAGSDKIEISGPGGVLQLGGVLNVISMNDRTSANFWSDTPRTIVDNTAGGAIGDLPSDTGFKFDDVVPDPEDNETSHHIGQGAFLREVIYKPNENA